MADPEKTAAYERLRNDPKRRALAQAAHKQALDVLKIQETVTKLATRFDTKLVMRVLRGWLDYMDRQDLHSDGVEEA